MLKTNILKNCTNIIPIKSSKNILSQQIEDLKQKKQLINCKIEEYQSRKILIVKLQKEIILHKHIIGGILTQIQEYQLIEKQLLKNKEMINNDLNEIVHDYQILEINVMDLSQKIIQIYRINTKGIDEVRLQLIQFQINHKNSQFKQKLSIRSFIIAFFKSLGYQVASFSYGVELEISKIQKCREFQYFAEGYINQIQQTSPLERSIFISHIKQYVKILQKGQQIFQTPQNYYQQPVSNKQGYKNCNKQKGQQPVSNKQGYQNCNKQKGQKDIEQLMKNRKQLKRLNKLLNKKSQQQKLLNSKLQSLVQIIKIKYQLIEQQQKIKIQLLNKIKCLKLNKNEYQSDIKQLNQIDQALIYLKQKIRYSQNIIYQRKQEEPFNILQMETSKQFRFKQGRLYFNPFGRNNQILASLKCNHQQLQMFHAIDISQIKSYRQDIKNLNIMSLKSPKRQSRKYKNNLGSPSPWK